MSKRDRAAEQLSEFKKAHDAPSRATNLHGYPLPSVTACVTVGPRGPVLLQDAALMDHLSHFANERIPERLVHAKGGGALGYFEVTHDITKYTKARIFDRIGKKTPLVVRFSTVHGEAGSADTIRDPRGFGVKFYTEDGNWDLLGYSTPCFFIRDPFLMPSFTHSAHRNPVTHLPDFDQQWDFLTLRPESTHQVAFVYSDRGIPDGYRKMHGYGCHTYKFVNDEGKAVYCKFHWSSDQGIKNIPPDTAKIIAGADPDHDIRDLYNAIHEKNFPSWTFSVQIMTFEEAEKYPWNPFDLTKIWRYCDFPRIPVGKIVLNQNPRNYFSDIEQMALSPGNMVPGIEPSPDKMLQGRIFAYPNTLRHRLGSNYPQIPINCPYNAYTGYIRDGPMSQNNNKGAPIYYPNSFHGPEVDPFSKESVFHVSGDAERIDTVDDDNFSQVGLFWNKVLKADERKRLVENLASDLKNCLKFIQDRAIKNFTQVDEEFGRMLKKAIRGNDLVEIK